MGLDITYYGKLTPAVGNEAFDETGELNYDDGWFQVCVNEHFSGRENGLKDRHAYKSEISDSFRAGSYSGYNEWREQLAVLAGWPEGPRGHASGVWTASEGPFWELINFSDCEGTIGPETSAKLAKDFAEYQAKADEHEVERFKKLYAKWRTAFEVASDGGCVVFH